MYAKTFKEHVYVKNVQILRITVAILTQMAS